MIATKVYNTRSEWPNDGRLSALHIRQACDDSLRRMQTDHIDLYQMHHVDRDTPWDEIWQAMDVLVAQGKVLYVGSSNFAGVAHREGERGRGAARLARSRVGAEPLQPERAHGRARGAPRVRATTASGVIPWSPLGGGLLGGVLADRASGRAARQRRTCSAQVEAHAPAARAWEKLCAEIGAPPADVALAWLLHNPVVTAPIIGPRTVEQVDTAMGALDVQLDDDVLAELDEIFPGPGRSRTRGLRLVGASVLVAVGVVVVRRCAGTPARRRGSRPTRRRGRAHEARARCHDRW